VPKGMGHCEIFDFVCKGERGCMAGEAVGEEEMEDEGEED